MLIRGCVNQLCGETPTDLRVIIAAPSTNFFVYVLLKLILCYNNIGKLNQLLSYGHQYSAI
jgi:hypothetical protein